PSDGELPTKLVDVSAAVSALRTAVTLLTMSGVPLAITQGEFAQMREGDTSAPADGGSAALGVMKDLEPLPSAAGSWVASYGDTFISLVEFRPDGPPIAQGLLVYGNTSEPSAPRYRTQVDLFSKNQLRPMPSLA